MRDEAWKWLGRDATWLEWHRREKRKRAVQRGAAQAAEGGERELGLGGCGPGGGGEAGREAADWAVAGFWVGFGFLVPSSFSILFSYF